MKTIRVTETDYNNETITTEYGVNGNGSGLWKNGRQIKGTCDFHASTKKALVAKLRRMYDYTEIKMVRNSAEGF